METSKLVTERLAVLAAAPTVLVFSAYKHVAQLRALELVRAFFGGGLLGFGGNLHQLITPTAPITAQGRQLAHWYY